MADQEALKMTDQEILKALLWIENGKPDCRWNYPDATVGSPVTLSFSFLPSGDVPAYYEEELAQIQSIYGDEYENYIPRNCSTFTPEQVKAMRVILNGDADANIIGISQIIGVTFSEEPYNPDSPATIVFGNTNDDSNGNYGWGFSQVSMAMATHINIVVMFGLIWPILAVQTCLLVLPGIRAGLDTLL
jgi:hypothetical protein